MHPPKSSHRKCYAADLGGCSTTISSEHFFSRRVLELLGEGISLNASGFTWQSGSSRSRPSPASLTAKILCTHHNSELSPLDAECLKLFHFFEEADKTLAKANCEGEYAHDVDGELFERWVLKALVGVVASGNAMTKDAGRVRKAKPPLSWLRFLFGLAEMPKDWGLYLVTKADDSVMCMRGIFLCTHNSWKGTHRRPNRHP